MNYQPYSVRFRPEERQMLKEIAYRLERSQQETVRSLVRIAHEYFVEQEQQQQENKPNQ